VVFGVYCVINPSFACSEVSAYGQDDVERRVGSGLSEMALVVRLRYEIRRTFAPYIGLE